MQQSTTIDSPTDFNFKRKAKITEQTSNEQMNNYEERGSIFLSQIPYSSTEHSSILEKTDKIKDSIHLIGELSRDFTKSINVTSIMVQTDIPKKVQEKCKSLILKKISE